MVIAELLVESGKKLNDDHEEKIRTKLAGKRLQVMLDAADVNDKQAVTNVRGVEKEIIQALRDQAPLLLHAKDLVFKRPVKALGDCKLMISIEAKPAFPCTLTLQVPEQRKQSMSGSYAINSLFDKAKFSDILNIRFCRATIDYSIRQPGADTAKRCTTALHALNKAVVADVDDTINKTMAALNKGLAAEGSAALDWKGAKKLVDQLNKDVQRIINTISDQGNAALAKVLPGAFSANEGPCSVTAMFSKFDILGSVYFAGGGPPSANEKSIKRLKGAVSKLHATAEQLDASTIKLVKEGDAFCRKVTKALAADTELQKAVAPSAGKDATADTTDAKQKRGDEAAAPKEISKKDAGKLAERIDKNLGAKRGDLQKLVEENSDLLEKEYKQAGELSGLVGGMKKVHEKEKKDAQSPEDKKDHIALKREFDLFTKEVDQFEATLKESMGLCKALSDLVVVPACYAPGGGKKIQDKIDTLEQKRLGAITKRLLKMCDTAIDLIEE